MPSRESHRSAALAAVLVLSSALAGCTGPALDVEPEPDPEGLRVLFIGNSLTEWNELPDMVRWLLQSADVAVGRVESVAVPGTGLEDHWLRGATRTRVDHGAFDVVVMQQGPSATEGRPSLLEFSERFAEKIRDAGGQPALYMVWPSTARSFDFDGVSDSYRTAAEQADGLLFPAGEAWRAAWRRNPELALYGPDGFHPSEMGSFLAALVMFEQLSGQDPATLPPIMRTPTGLEELAPETFADLAAAASEANRDFGRAATAP